MTRSWRSQVRAHQPLGGRRNQRRVLAQAWRRSWTGRRGQRGDRSRVAALPRQGAGDYELIRRGGPFPHAKDGVGVRQPGAAAPAQARGYYREYTVPTPASRDRGARRIVCGGPARDARMPAITPLTTTPVFAGSCRDRRRSGPSF